MVQVFGWKGSGEAVSSKSGGNGVREYANIRASEELLGSCPRKERCTMILLFGLVVLGAHPLIF